MSDPSVNPFIPVPLNPLGFNNQAVLPCGLTVESIHKAMVEFVGFLEFLNIQLQTRRLPRLECLMMQANFSSLVGEFMVRSIPKYFPGIVRNRYHNGYPDMVPSRHYLNDAVQRGDVGIEVKASRYLRGWQGHNAEDGWLMVFMFSLACGADVPDEDTGDPIATSVAQAAGATPSRPAPAQPFQFERVAAAHLVNSDWTFSGRSATSRRTITASVNESGRQKMNANLVYQS